MVINSDLGPVDYCLEVDHITLWVSNAKQCAAYFCFMFGFQPYAYKGIETGSRDICCHVVKQQNILFVFVSPLHLCDNQICNHLAKKGEMIKDVAFKVDNLDECIRRAKENNAKVIQDVWQESDNHGRVKMAIISGYGDITHTLIERCNYHGHFLPHFHPHIDHYEILDNLPPIGFKKVDHFVNMIDQEEKEQLADYYCKSFGFIRSPVSYNVAVKDNVLEMIVLFNSRCDIVVNITGPKDEDTTSQLRQFIDYNYGSGVQHIAFTTEDIIKTVMLLKQRGVQFLHIPSEYYARLKVKLASAKIRIKEDLYMLQQLGILLDFDDNGYLLQLFAKPILDRPTTYFEIIQRNNFAGFGTGNVRELYDAVEREKEKRENQIVN